MLFTVPEKDRFCPEKSNLAKSTPIFVATSERIILESPIYMDVMFNFFRSEGFPKIMTSVFPSFSLSLLLLIQFLTFAHSIPFY